jgi:hypothetical protein
MNTRKKINFEEIEFFVPSYYAAALCLGDFSGYDEGSESEITNFICSTLQIYGHANFMYDFDFEPEQRIANDINNFLDEVCRVTLLIEKK